jgi:histone H3/H4
MNSNDTEELMSAIKSVLDAEVKASTKAMTASTKAASGIKLASYAITGLMFVIGYFALEVRNSTLENAKQIYGLDKRVTVIERDVQTILKTTTYKDK